jgi:hypothetical protein
MPAVCAALLLGACAYVPMGDGEAPVAVRVADRWATRNVPGFAVDRPSLTPVVQDSGPYWLVRYAPPPGGVTAAPQVVVAKATGRIVRVDYGR